MFGDGGHRHLMRLGQLHHRRVALRQPRQDRAAGAVGEGAERGVEARGLKLNH